MQSILVSKMKVSVFIEEKNERKELELEAGASTIDLLKKLNINQVTAVISKNGKIVPEETILKDKDEIEIFSVISGG